MRAAFCFVMWDYHPHKTVRRRSTVYVASRPHVCLSFLGASGAGDVTLSPLVGGLGTPEHPQGRHSALPMLVSVQGWAKGVAASKLGRLLVSNHPKRCAVLRLVSISSATRAHEEERKHRYLVYPRCASHRSCALLHRAPSRSLRTYAYMRLLLFHARSCDLT